MTIFTAYRLYALIDALPALALMLAVVVLSGALAVLQSSPALAALGTTGGFLAPILASTGSGSHVSLFSYYLILNAGVVGLAWFRAWRVLNWLGFVFTFGVGLFWGSQYYEPALFATTEPFLIAFFAFYLAVVVLFALRQPPNLRGYIDGSLTFGMPAIAFAMQSRLVGDIPFGRAYSAVVVSAVYLGLARVLWRRAPDLRALAEAFLALSVVFLTLAIPLAFGGHVVAAGWALEGAALVWIGFKQNRLLARTLGALLLLGAGLAFDSIAGPVARDLPVLNSAFLGRAAIAIASGIAAYQYFRFADRRRREEAVLEWITLGWGFLWWCAAIIREVDAATTSATIVPALAGAFASTAVVLAAIAKWRAWPALAYFCLPFLPILFLLAGGAWLFDGQIGPWANGGWAAWPGGDTGQRGAVVVARTAVGRRRGTLVARGHDVAVRLPGDVGRGRRHDRWRYRSRPRGATSCGRWCRWSSRWRWSPWHRVCHGPSVRIRSSTRPWCPPRPSAWRSCGRLGRSRWTGTRHPFRTCLC